MPGVGPTADERKGNTSRVQAVLPEGHTRIPEWHVPIRSTAGAVQFGAVLDLRITASHKCEAVPRRARI